MVTIRDLARRAGVSVATASRVFNTPEAVSPATRRRVLAAAERLGYLPNESARALATKRSHLVGLVWETGGRASGWRHPFLQEILVALKTALGEHGLHLLLVAPPEGGGEDRYLRAVRRHTLDGVVLIDDGSRDPAVLSLAATGVPCVALDLELAGPRATFITSDNAGGGRLAAAHLVGLGHRRVAAVTGPAGSRPSRDRLAGFREELCRLGEGLPDELVAEGDWYHGSGEAGMRRLLALPDPPSAVFAFSDEMAAGALRAALALGLRVPQDLAVVGFDDIELASLVTPGLTTVAQDRHGFGAAAADALLAMLREPGDGAPAPVVLPTRLVVRDSA